MCYLLLVFIALLFPTVALDDAPPLIGWQDGVAVAWDTPDASPEPLYPEDTPRIPDAAMLSPDGAYVVYSLTEDGITGGEFPLEFDGPGYVLHELATGMEQVITSPGLYSRRVRWSPDSSQIAWVRYDTTEDNGGFNLEVYDIATEEVTLISDAYYPGYRDGGAGTAVPAAPGRWTGDVLVQEASGFDREFGDFADITVTYNAATGEQTFITPGLEGYLIVPFAVVGATNAVFISSYGLIYDRLIAVEEGRRIPNLVPTPQLRAHSATDDDLTFVTYVGTGGYTQWLAQLPEGELIETGVEARMDEVYPMPDGLLYETDDGDYAFWQDGSTESPRLDATPLWQTTDWFIPDCPQRRFSFINALTESLIATHDLTVYTLPGTEPIAEIPAGEQAFIREGSLCVDGINWLLVSVGDDNGWIPETIDADYTLEAIETGP